MRAGHGQLKPFLGLAFVLASLALPASTAVAQDAEHHHHDQSVTTLFPAREASGTAWLPDDTPMYGVMRTWRGWQVMLHGQLFAQLLIEPGERHRTGGFSTHQISSVNWGMATARRAAGNGRIGLHAMLSAEPWTVSDCGFINYLANGEVCEGDTIHDRQHPHDLFMELAADYDRPLKGSLRWQVYGGLAGEPALGPPAFPHRPSAMPNPIAPIAHHWLDSTHISFGLVTAGLYQSRWKGEVSVFNGREPDENRANLDLGPLDSVSGRVTFLASHRLSVQVSAGHLREAELQFGPRQRTDIDRATASVTYHRLLSNNGVWATTAAYGVNSGRQVNAGLIFDATTHAGLLESALTIAARHTWFGRAELVGKPAHDLHADEFGTRVFPVAKLEAGYVRQFAPWKQMVTGVGGVFSANIVPPDLAPRYGGRFAPGYGVFLSLKPARHAM